MGQYYIWANPDKKQYIDDEPFEGTGFMLNCSVHAGQPITDAACTMIAGPWCGDLVDMSDEAPGSGYRDVTRESSASWINGPTVMAGDGGVRRALADKRFREELENRGWTASEGSEGRSISGALEVLAALAG